MFGGRVVYFFSNQEGALSHNRFTITVLNHHYYLGRFILHISAIQLLNCLCFCTLRVLTS